GLACAWTVGDGECGYVCGQVGQRVFFLLVFEQPFIFQVTTHDFIF
ncbi:MAG: hypothetical protein ICV62_18420, partial [Cyanobacteria bacterium Co-bin13]|nr:hypothetical protein [Cyanobacteria bacterium Co-bin13]